MRSREAGCICGAEAGFNAACPVHSGVPEPAECELEAIAALLQAAENYRAATWAGPSYANVARWLFDRGVRIQDGPALAGGVPEQGLREAAQRLLATLNSRMGHRSDVMLHDYGPREDSIACGVHRPDCSWCALEAALERPRPALPAPKAFCVQCGFAQMDTTRVLDGQTIPAPWQVDQCGAAWSDVYSAANSVCANWLTEGHATPKLSRHLQTLSTALMILDQKRVMTPAPMDGDTFTWKERADKAEAELAQLRGAALPAPEPLEQDVKRLNDAILGYCNQRGVKYHPQLQALAGYLLRFGGVRGAALPAPLDLDALERAFIVYWKDFGTARHNLTAAIREYLRALPAEHAPPDPTDYGLLNRAIELLMANEREYAPSNAASDWYLRDQRVLALVREVTTRGSRPALAGSPDDAEIFALLKVLAEQDCESWGCEFPASRHACAPTRARRLLGRRVSGTPEEHP